MADAGVTSSVFSSFQVEEHDDCTNRYNLQTTVNDDLICDIIKTS
jgi:hypothetical protein